ncbi:YfdX family protein [Massilia sp. R2A-15]|uniref:YfdX family protein n=1 Tax=Massilia sp. R2A-15 TaxID=3064278 RepID=UPI002734E831|nr:YfdX family protein [Massilia sp. R2A-15]WLI91093.1 YfdX family protein [Massilia sp. R2A-15]
MKPFMLTYPNEVIGSSNGGDRKYSQRSNALKGLAAALLSVGLVTAAPLLAAESSTPSKLQMQAGASKAVQSQVDKQTAAAAAEKRKQLLTDAAAAIAQTQQALKALEDKKNDVALKALADATGKLELIVARDPSLRLAPIATEVVTFDVFAEPETLKLAIADAKRALSNGDIPRARPLVEALASETQIRTTNIPLATYPSAIKGITPLIDAGKIEEAKTQLEMALSTLVVTTEVIPLPKLRAENLLKDAQALAEKKDRSKDDNEKLANQLKSVRAQLQMAEMLGYGKKSDFQPMYAQLESIEKASAAGKSGSGWFAKIRKQVAEAF